jgi:TRAP-type C4-dicarboxylate transport system permease small subunit
LNGVPTGQLCCGLVSDTGGAFTFFNPLKFGTVEGVLTAVLGQLRNIIVILAIIFIIIGALMYITSTGNESRMTLAKSAILAAMIGLALAIAAPSFLKELAAILGWQNVIDASNSVQGAQSFTEIAGKVLNFLLSVVGVIAIITLIFGGFTYLTAAGDEGRAETGKKIVTYAVIAIAVALSALVLVTQVTKFFV